MRKEKRDEGYYKKNRKRKRERGREAKKRSGWKSDSVVTRRQ